jgi:formylglycine-generating enzyme required for sulfatase activity
MRTRGWPCVFCGLFTLLSSCNKLGDIGLHKNQQTKADKNAVAMTSDWPLSQEAAVLLQQQEAQRLKIPAISRLNLGDNVGIDLVLVPPGVFPMGSESSAEEGNPPHLVKISRGFLMGRYEIIWQQYLRVVDLKDVNLSTRQSVEEYVIPKKRTGWIADVDWNHAKLFCDKLSKLRGIKARLPTEAEWEYACRAGTILRYGEWDSIDDTKASVSQWPGPDGKLIYSKKEYAFDRIGQYKPNRWGLHDMLGNSSEWCLDRYSSRFDLKELGQIDPYADGAGSHFRVFRGKQGETVFNRLGDAKSAYDRAIRVVVELDDTIGNKVVEVKKQPREELNAQVK